MTKTNCALQMLKAPSTLTTSLSIKSIINSKLNAHVKILNHWISLLAWLNRKREFFFKR